MTPNKKPDRSYIARLRRDPRTHAMAQGWIAQATAEADLRHYVANAPMRRRWSLTVMAAVIICGTSPVSALVGFVTPLTDEHRVGVIFSRSGAVVKIAEYRESTSPESITIRNYSGTPGGGEGERSNQGAKRAKCPSSTRSTISSISSLPLSAKVGMSLIIALFAWLIQAWGFYYLTLGRSNTVKGLLCLAVGIAGWMLPILFWWAST